MQRTHTCGQLRGPDIGKSVLLQGWCHSRRDHGGLIFIDLRDRYGITQIVFDPRIDEKVHEAAGHLKREDVVSVKGKVERRKPDMENPKLDTGMVEVFVSEMAVLNRADTPPIEIDARVTTNEDMRLKYRYLDLRKPEMQRNLAIRHSVIKAMRDYLDGQKFLEIETPILAKSTPEGARDYLVPSRVHPGKFYALPQSPQIFKQLLMVGGCDRYFQIARCFRDEDLRADRQPEFTQLDIEMSFISQEDIFALIEGLVKKIWKDIVGIEVPTPFGRLAYHEAMETYGSDKPDTRFGLHLTEMKDVVRDSQFKVFTDITGAGGMVKCINAKGCASFTRTDIEDLTAFVAAYGSKGMAWMKVTNQGLESSIVKFFSKDIQDLMIKRAKAAPGDLLLFIGDKDPKVVYQAAGALRLELGKKLNLLDQKMFNFLWVVDFPMFEYSGEEGRLMAMHHPFTSPKDKELMLLEKEPLKVKANAYDIVLNGTEIGGGSIRIHQRAVQSVIFRALGISEEEAKEKFGFLLEAFRYGAPPHGGIALGIDRLIAIITGNESIREVIAFPKTKSAESLMDSAPNDVSEKQLQELHIRPDIVREQKNVAFNKLVEVLQREKMQYEVVEHKPVFTSREAAEARGTELRQGCKALILKTEEGFIQAVVPGDKEIDLKKLQRITLFKHLEMASPQDVKRASGCDIGAVPPAGNLFGLKVWFDKGITQNEIVAFNAGSHSRSIKMRAKDLRQVVNPVIAEFSQ